MFSARCFLWLESWLIGTALNRNMCTACIRRRMSQRQVLPRLVRYGPEERSCLWDSKGEPSSIAVPGVLELKSGIGPRYDKS
jgi:hypothetical protein